ncbi:MAG: hypothetical protein IJ446_08300 [Oscillospiraceae bacterium]|nr:hypothetical protein [Oscillospiraceae bacterium]MBQ8569204.1 hypothetical protein [Oscillospiraceae bacterium]
MIILPSTNGKLILSGSQWCRITLKASDITLNLGCEVDKFLYKNILMGITGNISDDKSVQLIDGIPYRHFCGLSDPHASLYVSCVPCFEKHILCIPEGAVYKQQIAENGKEIFIFDEKRSTEKSYILELGEKDYLLWLSTLSKAIMKLY